MIKEKKADFTKFWNSHKELVVNRPAFYQPDDINLWFDRLQENQQTTRNLLGGTEKFLKVDFTRTLTQIDANEIVNTVYYPIAAILPKYWTEYQYKGLLYTNLVREYQVNGVGFAKHVLYYARNIANPKPTEDQMAALEKIVSTLGAKWAKLGQAEPVSYNVCLSTKAKAYCLIGFYGPNPSSCWRNNRWKYVAGLLPNVLVFTIYDTKKPEIGKILCRGLAYVRKEQNIVIFSNVYSISSIMKSGDELHVLKKIAETLLQDQEVENLCSFPSTYSADQQMYMQGGSQFELIFGKKNAIPGGYIAKDNNGYASMEWRQSLPELYNAAEYSKGINIRVA